jgi:hypothetical protein
MDPRSWQGAGDPCLGLPAPIANLALPDRAICATAILSAAVRRVKAYRQETAPAWQQPSCRRRNVSALRRARSAVDRGRALRYLKLDGS